ncbi:MAG TPA: cupin domain-containing protein [Thermoleophilaceae bacterium]
MLEHLAPRGSGSPLHVHHNEDEWFYVTEGELSVSSDTARFLLVTEPAGFEGFVRTLSEPAGRLVIPPPATEPPDVEAMARLAAEYGIEILGPPGIHA